MWTRRFDGPCSQAGEITRRIFAFKSANSTLNLLPVSVVVVSQDVWASFSSMVWFVIALQHIRDYWRSLQPFMLLRVRAFLLCVQLCRPFEDLIQVVLRRVVQVRIRTPAQGVSGWWSFCLLKYHRRCLTCLKLTPSHVATPLMPLPAWLWLQTSVWQMHEKSKEGKSCCSLDDRWLADVERYDSFLWCWRLGLIAARRIASWSSSSSWLWLTYAHAFDSSSV